MWLKSPPSPSAETLCNILRTAVKKTTKIFMTKQEAIQIETQLTEMFKTKHPDIKTHIDFIDGTDKIVISFFWNRLSQQKWDDSKSFRMESLNYESIVTSEIIPFFN